MINSKLRKVLSVHKVLSELISLSMYDVSANMKFNLALLFKESTMAYELYVGQLSQLLQKYNVHIKENYIKCSDENLEEDEKKAILSKFSSELEALEETEIVLKINKIKFEKEFKYLKFTDFLLFEDFMDFSLLEEYQENQTNMEV